MTQENIVVIGASAGGVATISNLLNQLPHDLPAAILVVIHLSPQSPGLLPEIMQKHSKLKVIDPKDGDCIRSSHVYIAPPNKHMVIHRDRKIQLIVGPRINRSRPAIDPLFRSAALTYGNSVIGIILSGLLDDGILGLHTVKNYGGTTIVQDPNEAPYPDMPLNALQKVNIDYCLTVKEIAPTIIQIISNPHPTEQIQTSTDSIDNKTTQAEAAIDENLIHSVEELGKVGSPSFYTCPDCHGTLWEVSNNHVLHFRCRVGHVYGTEDLAVSLSENVENALWAALRTLEESANISQKLAEKNSQNPVTVKIAKRFKEREIETRRHAAIIKKILLKKTSSKQVEKR